MILKLKRIVKVLGQVLKEFGTYKELNMTLNNKED